MQQQTTIMTAQDELNRMLFARRAKLRLFAVGTSGMTEIHCINEGNKTAQQFFWHLAIPNSAQCRGVWDSTGNVGLGSKGSVTIEDVQCAYYKELVKSPLFPTREIRLAAFSAVDGVATLWGRTVSEDGVEPPQDQPMSRVERRGSATELAADI
jgi:hypothetical protein